MLTIGHDQRSWTALAACAEVDPELFFPDKGQSPATAIGVCYRCPVRTACLDDALANEARDGVTAYGIWGGLTAEQRNNLRGKTSHPAAPCPDCGTPTRLSTKGQPRLCGLCRHATTIRRTA